MAANREVTVSVVMPAWNCAATIGQAVRSVLAQDVPLELLVIDDRSPDDLQQALKPYAKDTRLRLLRNETNIGAAASRNRGCREAKGAYIAFLDADDWWEAGKLKKQLQLLKQTGAVLCCTARELVSPDGTRTGRVIPVKERIPYRQLLRHNSINCSSVVVRRDAALAFPMEHEDSHEDYITWMKIVRTYGSAVAVNEPLLYYRLSATGKSGNKLKSAAMTYTAYRYAGYGRCAAAALFVRYAFHGVWKYLASYRRREKRQ